MERYRRLERLILQKNSFLKHYDKDVSVSDVRIQLDDEQQGVWDSKVPSDDGEARVKELQIKLAEA